MTAFLRSIASSPFVQGFARGFDLFGIMNERSPYPAGQDGAQADAKAIASDWVWVGQDLADAADNLQRDLEETTV